MPLLYHMPDARTKGTSCVTSQRSGEAPDRQQRCDGRRWSYSLLAGACKIACAGAFLQGEAQKVFRMLCVAVVRRFHMRAASLLSRVLPFVFLSGLLLM